MMPSPPIDYLIDTRPSGRSPAGSAQACASTPDWSAVASPISSHTMRPPASTDGATLTGRKPIVTSAPLKPPQAIPRGQIPIAPAAPPLHHCPRFRALALFGRRPPYSV